MNKKRQCSPPEANQLLPLAIDCLTYINPKITFLCIVFVKPYILGWNTVEIINLIELDILKGPLGALFFTDSFWKLLDIGGLGPIV